MLLLLLGSLSEICFPDPSTDPYSVFSNTKQTLTAKALKPPARRQCSQFSIWYAHPLLVGHKIIILALHENIKIVA